MDKFKKIMIIALPLFLLSFGFVWAGELTDEELTTFVAEEPAVASEVNANFDAVQTDVNDNDSRITTNAGAITTSAGVIITNTAGISTNAGAIATNATGVSANASAIATKQNRVTGTSPSGSAITGINENGSVNYAAYSNNITTFSLAGITDNDIPVNSTPTLLRNIGTFDKQSASSNIIVYYQDLLKADSATAICALQIRIDNEPSGTSLSPPIIINFNSTNNICGLSMGIFTGLTVGEHTVSIYYRNLADTCDRNSGNWNGQIAVIETP